MNTTTGESLKQNLGNTRAESQKHSCEPSNNVYRRILVGTDLSRASEPVFEHALKLAKQNCAALLIIHAYNVPGSIAFLPPECYEEWHTLYHEKAESLMKSFAAQAKQQGVHCHGLIFTGVPEDAIAEAVKRLKIDLLVIGTHHRRGVSRLVLGSLAARISLRVGCPVLTFHTVT
jgi:nucleotide-binding universal stress UspA family protein